MCFKKEKFHWHDCCDYIDKIFKPIYIELEDFYCDLAKDWYITILYI